MITTILREDLPLLNFLGIEVSVIKNSDHITNMVECELPAGGRVIEKLLTVRDHANNLTKVLNQKRA